MPAQLDELVKFALFTRDRLASVRAQIHAIGVLGLAGEVLDLKKREALDMAEQLLDAETRIGELTREIPTKEHSHPKRLDSVVAPTKTETIARLGLQPKQVERFETLASNPEVVAQVKADARENDDLPTRTEVLRRVAGSTPDPLAFHSARR